MFLPRFCIAKLVFWVLGFVQSYWWMNLNHVAWRYYTPFIDNFERMTLATELRQFYRRLRLGLDQSSHQINLEVILPSDSDCFCCGFRVGWHFFNHVLFGLTYRQVYNIVIAWQQRVSLLISCEHDDLTLSSCKTDNENVSARLLYLSGISEISGIIWYIYVSNFFFLHFLFFSFFQRFY